MTLKHNLSVQMSRIAEMINEAIDDNQDYAVECLNAVFKQLQMTEKELEQLKQSLEKDKVMMKPYRCIPQYIEGKIRMIVEFLGQGSSEKKLKDEVLGK